MNSSSIIDLSLTPDRIHTIGTRKYITLEIVNHIDYIFVNFKTKILTLLFDYSRKEA